MGIFTRFFSKKPRWNGSPEMYLAMIMELQSMNNNIFSIQEVVQLGEIMQNVINIKLSPYQDFSDLLARGTPDFTQIKLIREQLKEHHARVDLKKAIYGNRADLGDDDIMKSESADAKFARKFVDDLGRYVEFKKEDEDHLT